jgi:hypothetical protein
MMSEVHAQPETGDDNGGGESSTAGSTTPAEHRGDMRLSMHDGVAVWCDCCSCEAEPYWVTLVLRQGDIDGYSESRSR